MINVKKSHFSLILQEGFSFFLAWKINKTLWEREPSVDFFRKGEKRDETYTDLLMQMVGFELKVWGKREGEWSAFILEKRLRERKREERERESMCIHRTHNCCMTCGILVGSVSLNHLLNGKILASPTHNPLLINTLHFYIHQ